jgi:hypothetical protein
MPNTTVISTAAAPAALADGAAPDASGDSRRRSLHLAAKDFPLVKELEAADARATSLAASSRRATSSKGSNSSSSSSSSSSKGGVPGAGINRAKPCPVVPGRALKVMKDAREKKIPYHFA